ncbi:MAG: Crp/Fnr family transcriptional regulator [Crocinitomicaceae bacterium]|nr:Crp/Fnr family transcriptional regulator [Crocinitomicaceae bacterium]|tara:strand:+ start:3418 stop:4125 length:708 start_codon:yes stop_codon:yes gene_type:complete
MGRHSIDICDCSQCENKDSLFCKLSDAEKDTISTNKGSNFYRKGQVIFYEDNHPNGLYCIYKGKVKITKFGDEGKDQIVRFAGDSDLLGYRALLSGDTYRGTATAMEDTHVCHISKSNFFDVMTQNNNFSYDIIKLLSNDLKKSEQKLVNISQKPVIERIAESLLILKNRFGVDEDGMLNVVLTRREIGDMAGVTTETSIRTLSALKKDGIIELVGKKVKIINERELVRIANLYD